MTEKDYIGFDPIAWVRRLQDVGAAACFPKDERDIIRHHLQMLEAALERWNSSKPKE